MPDTTSYWVRLTSQFTGRVRSDKSSRTARMSHAHLDPNCRYLTDRKRASKSLITQMDLSGEAAELVGVCRECQGVIDRKPEFSPQARAAYAAKRSQNAMGWMVYLPTSRRWQASYSEAGKRRHLKASRDRTIVETALAEFRARKLAQRARVS